METRKHLAAEKKRCGSHNCAQAILCTYADKAGIDDETARNIANAFGAGMGNMEGTCGALVGAGITLGLATKDRAKSMRGMKQMMTRFQQRNGATQCKLLKGVGTKIVLRECPDCVADAAEFLEDELSQQAIDR
ncbi:MAG: C_GCAxxG_C_C family protein [Bacteroidaceae bacterium]|nr:C_GCAxxG_C_C family protein [Bacteroidaceae bacterium]